MNPELHSHHQVTRRAFLQQGLLGVGGLALAGLDAPQLFSQGSLITPHVRPRAKRMIVIHLAGSPPQQDLFDYKPKLLEYDGKPCPEEMIEKRFAFIKGHPKILASPYEFQRHGSNGTWVSELLPHFPSILKHVTVVKSMVTDQFNHAPAQLFLYTGSPRIGRPSMGSWLTYGLGSESRNLPGYVVLVSGGKVPSAGKTVWGSGFLPSVHQGVQCRSSGDPILYVDDPPGYDRKTRRRSLDALRELNRKAHEEHGDPSALARIEQYELAYRMQIAAPEVMDISQEPPEVHALYGTEPGKTSFANNCLLARRLVENGVRFVQLFDWGWDTHGTSPNDDIMNQLPRKCRETDRPSVALVQDLARRGLLEDTIVVWSGEFGRTAMNEERNGSKFLGRDHHPGCFTIWMAGGGIKAGFEYGATDELGHHVTENPVGVHDLHATLLHLFGLDHKKLTYRSQGRDFRLTDVHGHVIRELIS